MLMIEHAITFATAAMVGIIDKAGKPLILHALGVMSDPELTGKEYLQVVAVLHDVVEDAGVPLHRIEELFGPEIARSVNAITHRPSEPRVVYYDRVNNDPLATIVKKADIRHNLRPERLRLLRAEERERLVAKYSTAMELLEED